MSAHYLKEMSLENIITHMTVGTSGTTATLLNLIKSVAKKLEELQNEVTALKAENTTLRENNISHNNNSASDFWKQLGHLGMNFENQRF